VALGVAAFAGILPLKLPVISSSFLFEENFEDGKADGFTLENGNWKVVTEESGNKAYENSRDEEFWSTARFGSHQWENYLVECRVKLIEFDRTKDPGGIGMVQFRGDYGIVINPYWGGFGIDYLPPGKWETILDSKYNFEPGTWYTIRVEAKGKNIKVFLDGNLRMETDDSRASSGFLRLKTGPNTIVRFDDIRITAIEE
jgi:pectate lyase